MKAMILAAGSGTRLYPLTYTLPKPMVPVLNRPVMEHIIRHLAENGFDELMVNLHVLPEHIENYFHDGARLGVSITYSHEMEPLGTAGGVKNVDHFFDDTFLVVGGDDLSDINLKAMYEVHKEKHALATIGLSYEEDVSQYGVVVTDENDRVTEFQEKPKPSEAKSNWANNGIYIFEPAILNLIPEGQIYDFGSQLFPKLKNDKSPFFGYKAKGYWKDVGNLKEYRKTHFDCLEGKVKVKFPGKEIKPGVWVEDGVVLPEDIKITGPVLIGKNCKFGKNVTLEGPLVIGKYNIMGDNTVLKGSVTWGYNYFKDGVRVIDCLVGSECIVEEERVFERSVLGSGMKNILEGYFK